MPAANCTLDVKTFSTYGVKPQCIRGKTKTLYGHLKVNEELIWSSQWCGDPTYHIRGLTIFVLKPFDNCLIDGGHFCDSHWYKEAATNLVRYLEEVPKGTVLIGITTDEAANYLAKALPALAELGVDVSDVQFQGSFGFIAQKGYPEKTLLRKVTTAQESNTNPAKFTATVTGTSCT